MPDTVEMKKAVALGLIPPLLMLVAVWLFSHRVERIRLPNNFENIRGAHPPDYSYPLLRGFLIFYIFLREI
ncbi:MAG: hypothetical protein QXF52_12540 [Thermoproteota archaeon]